MKNDLEYIYDGTFEGFLCCIYQSLARKEIPKHIFVEEGLPLLGETATWIATDWDQAQKVYVSLSRQIGIEAQDIVKDAFLTHMVNREMILYQYILLGYRLGRTVLSDEDWPEVVPGQTMFPDVYQRRLILLVLSEVRKYRAEVKNIEGRMHFRSYSDVLISCITPINRVLPALANFFESRFRDSNFLVYDKTHQMAAVHREEGTMVTSMQHIRLPMLYDEANVYENLWKSWYDRMHIEVPENPRYAINAMRTPLWCEVKEE
ncbi:MAG: TIGR03915 family putative DNA repair protein [Clostridiales bacterium]|nr:TIGR03915 family putative DNA repair protein [Clostridiales bacterium]